MPDETGLDTSIPATGWQDTGRNAERPLPKRRRQKPATPSDEPETHTPRPQPPDGVGTQLDVIA